MAILGFELEEIVRLLALLEENRLDEILIEEEGRYLRIRGPRRSKPARPVFPSEVRPAGASAPPRPAISAPLSADRSGNGSAPLPTDHVALVSPMVGVFYRAGKPGDPPFIEIGQPIELNQTIGVIEAMKIFSEIPAEHSGVVVAIPAQDGQLVQAGSPLVILRQERHEGEHEQ